MHEGQRRFTDSAAREFDVEVNWSAPFLTLHAHHGGSQVAYAYLTIEDSCAELSDILVVEAYDPRTSFWKKLWSWPLPWPKPYRGNGAGTKLLAIALEELRTLGVRQLTGEIVENHDRLTRWYRRAGFSVGPDMKIELKF